MNIQVRQEALPARALPAAAQLLYARALSGDPSVDAPIGAGLSAVASTSKTWAKILAAGGAEEGGLAATVGSAQAPPSTPPSKNAAAAANGSSKNSGGGEGGRSVTRGGLAQPALDLSSSSRAGAGAGGGAPSTPGGTGKDSSNRGSTYSGSSSSGGGASSEAWVGVVPATVDYENDALVRSREYSIFGSSGASTI